MLVVAAGHGRVARTIAQSLTAVPGRKRFAPVRAGTGGFATALGYEASLGISTPADRMDALADATELVLVPSFDPRAIESLMALARAARAAGVERVHLVSLAGAQEKSPVTLLRWMGLVEREAAASGLRRTVLRCGPFMQAIPLFLQRDPAGPALVGPFRDTAFPWIDAEDAGDVLARIVGDPEAAEVVCQLSGHDQATFADAARLLGEALGERVRYVDVCLPEAQGLLERRGFPPQRVRAVTEYWDYLVSGVVRAPCCDLARELLGRPPRSLAQYFERFAAEQLQPA